MTSFCFDVQLPPRGSHKFSRKMWLAAIFSPAVFFIPITTYSISQYISNPHLDYFNLNGWLMFSIMFAMCSLGGVFNLKNHFRCRICNIPMAKRTHSLYCHSCRPFVTRSLECWPDIISCRICNIECKDYLSYENHFDQLHDNPAKKPWIHYHPEDNAIRKIT